MGRRPPEVFVARRPARRRLICVSLCAMIPKAAAAALALTLALHPLAAGADQRVWLYNPGNTIVLYLEENGWILQHVGDGKQTGPVRCYSLADKLTVDKGNGADRLEGCFVEIDRNGALRAPTPTKDWPLHRMVDLDAALDVEDRKTFAEVSIGGAAGNALGLYIGCADKHGDVRCRSTTARDGSVSWAIVFGVGKHGALRPVKP
jgi:hypothetical protein